MEQELLDQIEQYSKEGHTSRAFNTLKELFEYDEDAARSGVAHIVGSLVQWFSVVNVDSNEVIIIDDGLKIILNVSSVELVQEN